MNDVHLHYAVGLTLAATLPALATDHNWGAGAWGGSSNRCTNGGQGQTIAQNSECGSLDGFQHVYIDPDVPDNFRDGIFDALDTDFDNTPGIDYALDSANYSYTDVRVRVWTIPHSEAEWIYTTCAPDAIYGGGTGYYRWCAEQILRVDPTRKRARECFADSNLICALWAGCHEIGHTFGLQHPGDYSDNHATNDPDRATCLEYPAGSPKHYDINLDAIDKEELADCIPRPASNPSALTTACYAYGVH